MNYKYPWASCRESTISNIIRKDIPDFRNIDIQKPIDSLPYKDKLIIWIKSRVAKYSVDIDFSKPLSQAVSVNCANKLIVKPTRLWLILCVPHKVVYDFACSRLQNLQQYCNSVYKTSSDYRRHRIVQINEVNHRISIKSYLINKEYTIGQRQLYDVTSWNELDALATNSRPEFLTKRRARVSNHKKYITITKKLQNLNYTRLLAKESDFDYSAKLYKFYYKDKPVLIKKGAFSSIRADKFELTLKADIEGTISYLDRSIISYVRYKSTEPVLYTDSDYCKQIFNETKGLFEPYKKYYPSKPHGDYPKKFVCTRCGTVFAIPGNTKYSDLQCPLCDKKNCKKYSRESIKWLEDISSRFNLNIQHAENGKEFAIKLSKTSTHHVDGYCKEYNIVFEYHGSRWHGNPTVFYMDDHISPYDKSITAYQYLRKTISLENNIVNLGYNYIRIWDVDFIDEKRYKQWLSINTPRINRFIKQKK